MAFGMDEPTLDGNLRRVFARLFDVSEFADLPAGEKILWELAAQNLPKGEAGDYNQALMDLGATICLPKNPRCLLCPLIETLRGAQKWDAGIPSRVEAEERGSAPCPCSGGGKSDCQSDDVLLAQRPSEGLLGGMWEFPNGRVDQDPAKELTKVLNAAYKLRVRKKDALGIIQHAYTHFKVTVHAFRCEFVSVPKNKNLKWVKITDLTDYPMGKVDRGIANLL